MPVQFVTVAKFSAESGYTEDAIRTKIQDGVWPEGDVWIKAPDGRTLINIEGYNEWATRGSTRAFIASPPQPRSTSPATPRQSPSSPRIAPQGIRMTPP